MREAGSGAKIVLFGAGMKGQLLAKHIHDLPDKALCIIDNNSSKWGLEYYGIPICPPQELSNLNDNFHIYITTDRMRHKEEIRNQLYDLGYHKNIHPLSELYEIIFGRNKINKIIEAGIPMIYRSCNALDEYHLVFHGAVRRINLTFCCESGIDVPGITLNDSAEESAKQLNSIREGIIAESVKFSLLEDETSDEEHIFINKCSKCVRFQKQSYTPYKRKIRHINLSMYPSACQCKCIYCIVFDSPTNIYNKSLHDSVYENIFTTIEWLQKNNMVSKCVTWQVTCGEITIHPYRNRIYNLVNNSETAFYSNCFIFDGQIASNLSVNPRSSINLSIDSGTPETWYNVKGVDNFSTILKNLNKYRDCCSQPGQIILKYIILPGINDNVEDYQALVKIMSDLGVSDLRITSDVRIKYTAKTEQRDKIIQAAAHLTSTLYKNDMTGSIDILSPRESKTVKDMAHKICFNTDRSST